jgi:hypothetical protein
MKFTKPHSALWISLEKRWVYYTHRGRPIKIHRVHPDFILNAEGICKDDFC